MKIRDLLSLTHQNARKLMKEVAGARELTFSDFAKKLQKWENNEEFVRKLRDAGEKLYDEVVEKKLIKESEYGLDDWALQTKILDAIDRFSTPIAQLDETSDLVLLERLLGLIPQRCVKRAGKTVEISGEAVTLIINTGPKEYIFLFPLRSFGE